MGLRKENYYPLGTLVLVCIAMCYASIIYGQEVSEECSIRVKQEIRVNSMARQANSAYQSYFNYYDDWQMEESVFGSGDLNTTIDLVPFKTSEMLYISNFGFQIPEDSHIEGIIVKVNGKSTGDGLIRERAVKLLNGNGEIVGDNKAGKAYHSTEWDSEDGIWYYGTERDSWGSEWTTDMVNSSSFGVSIQIRNAASQDDASAYINDVSIEVYYTEIFRFCDGDCVSFSATQNQDIVSYLWRLPGEFELLSISEKADIINVGQADAVYGKYEICVDLTDKYDYTFTCCRPFIFEECITPSLGDRVWLDSNANGLQDNNEPGVEGVTIELYTSEGAYIEKTISDDHGNYLFADLLKDDYFIKTYLPEGFLFSPFNADDVINSDIDASNGPGTSRIIGLFDGDNFDIDIGIAEELKIGDMVWEDCNGDGIRTPDEKGLGGIVISLFNGTGVLIDEAISDSTGSYLFDQLYPGTYSLFFEAPQPFFATKANQGNPDEDSNINVNGHTGLIEFPAGGLVDNIDAGFVKYGSLGDFVWLDQDVDGIQDAGEPGLGQVTLKLINHEGIEVQSFEVEQSGYYSFDSILPGTYIIMAVPPVGYVSTLTQSGNDTSLDSDLTDNEGVLQSVPLLVKSGITSDDIDLGFIPSFGSIAGITWYDENVNGLYDQGESVNTDITVNLLDASGSIIKTTTSDDHGGYLFEEIDVGIYSITFSLMDGQLFTLQDEGDDESVDSDVDSLGSTQSLNVRPGEDITGINAGYVIPATVGDYVWFDENRNGFQDENESGLEGIELALVDAQDNIVFVTVTDQEGYYLFQNIFPGIYKIVLAGTGNLLPTNKIPGDEANDSDLTKSDDQLVIILEPLGYGEDKRTIDAGLMLPGGDINGLVWNDANQDGIRQEEEERLSNLPVQLLNSVGEVIVSSVTQEDGGYSFIGLPPGDYNIIIDVLGEYTTTLADIGDDAFDSDFTEQEGVVSTDILEVIEGLVLSNIDAGLIELSEVSGFVWNEADIDGIRSGNEEGFPGVEVILYTSQGVEVQRTITEQENGGYAFGRVLPDAYYVVFTIPEGYRITIPNVGDDDNIDSDVLDANGFGITEIFNVPGDKVNLSLGLIEIGFVSGLVWEDTNGNGIRDEGEGVRADVAVVLRSMDGQEVARTQTLSDGSYIFEDIDRGEYYIYFEIGDGYSATKANEGNDDNFDSDVTEENGIFTTSVFTVSIGGITAVDLGLLRIAEISGTVWIDNNGDGLLGEGEERQENITVRLFTAGGEIIEETTTDALGNYNIVEVLVGDYYIVFGVEGNFIPTIPLEGDNPLIDSDVTGSFSTWSTDLISLTDDFDGINAGLVTTSNISGLVWDDLNGNGLREAEESAVNGITVMLYNAEGVLVGETITNNIDGVEGAYLFSYVTSGMYYVIFDGVVDAVASDADVGEDDGIDSDVTGANGGLSTDTFILSGTDPISKDFGLRRLGDISGLVWIDSNENGTRDEGETNIDGVTVFLFDGSDTLVAQTMTGENGGGQGTYVFVDIPSGFYYVEFQIEEGFLPTLPGIGSEDIDSDVTGENGTLTTQTFLLSSAGIIFLDFGVIEEIEFGNISGMVWLDTNENGLRDDGEVGVDQVTVKLLNASGTEVAQAITGEIEGTAGSYQFMAVQTGTYYLVFDPVEGLEATLPNVGADDTLDSDVTDDNGPFSTPLFILTKDGIQHLDLGLIDPQPETANISGVIWNDTNFDGIREEGEGGIDDIIVKLFSSEGIEIATTGTTTVEGVVGFYQFSDIALGDYYIMFEIPVDYEVSPSDIGDDDTIDSDVTEENGLATTSVFSLTSTGVSNLDLGMVILDQISGIVWIDDNGNGTREAGESGRNGIMVILYDGEGIEVGRTTTSIIAGKSGSYQFNDLLGGIYYIQFEVMEGLYPTMADVGENDAIDSDVTEVMGPFTTSLINVPGPGLDNIDLGLLEASEISGVVWEDSNSDGLRDNDEPGTNGVTVILYNDADVAVSTAVTADISGVTGSYIFENIPQGEYYIQFEIEGAYGPTVANVGNDDTIDSDVTGENGPFTTSILLLTNNGLLNIDLGLIDASGGMITGRVWEDLDGDGIRETGEDLGSNLTVRLRTLGGALVAITTTSGNGTYMFTDITEGNYYVEFSVPSEQHGATIPMVGNAETDSDVTGLFGAFTTNDISISPGSAISAVDFGYYEYAFIGDFVWDDSNGNGLFDDGETGVNDIVVILFDSAGVMIDSIFTQSDDNENPGFYLFDGISPGLYYLKLLIPEGVGFTVPDAGSNSLDSDVTNANGEGTTDIFEIFSGDNETIYDVGLVFGDGLIGDFVWMDIDGNGIQGVNEAGLNGISLSIFTEEGALINSTVSSTSNDGLPGFYSFGGLDPGNYYLVAELPDTLAFTDPGMGGETLDSDITGSVIEGSTDIITVTNLPLNDIDIGVIIPSTIGNFVWEDINKNGLQDDGEPGVKDVEVIIFTSEGEEVASVFTDIQGNYLIERLKPGLYFLEFISPSSEFVFTEENAGMDDTIDSDVDASGTTALVSVTNGSFNPNVDAGIYNANTLIGGIVWLDENADGIRNENTLLEGVAVQLLDEDENIVQETTTNFAGRYALTDIVTGRYYVKVKPENNIYEFTQHNVGINGGRDSDVGANGMSALIKVDAGNDPVRIDAGIVVANKIVEEDQHFQSVQIDQIEITAVPSLTYGNISLTMSHTKGMVKVLIFDRTGRLVSSSVVDYDLNGGINLDLSQLHQGPYYIKAVTERGSATTMIYKF